MVQIPYTPVENTSNSLPFLSLQIASSSDTLNVMGLIESGVEMNVLPSNLGELLGLVWEQQTTPVTLGGQLATLEARLVTLDIIVPSVSEARLTQEFAWVRGGDVPVILGQNGFFKAFNVSFYGSQAYFDVSLATS